jgi:hypothetical protein
MKMYIIQSVYMQRDLYINSKINPLWTAFQHFVSDGNIRINNT